MPNGITVAIPVKSFTSPPPQIFNFQNKKQTRYVRTSEIIDDKMNLMLKVIDERIRFVVIPKSTRNIGILSGIMFFLMS